MADSYWTAFCYNRKSIWKIYVSYFLACDIFAEYIYYFYISKLLFFNKQRVQRHEKGGEAQQVYCSNHGRSRVGRDKTSLADCVDAMSPTLPMASFTGIQSSIICGFDFILWSSVAALQHVGLCMHTIAC